MKKYLIIIAVVLLCCTPIYAWWSVGGVGGRTPAAAPSCTTSTDSLIGGNTTEETNASVTSTLWAAQSFTITSGTQITTWRLKGNPLSATGDVVCDLRLDSSTHPGASAIASSQVSVAISGYSADTWMDMTPASAVTVNATKVWVVCRITGSNTFVIRRSDGTAPDLYEGGNYDYSDNSGSTWTAITGTDLLMEIYGCAP